MLRVSLLAKDANVIKKNKIRDNDNKHFMDTGNFFALVVSNYY